MSLPSHAGVLAVRLINEALVQADPEKMLAALLLPAAALPDVALPTARHYHDVLARARRLKAQVGWHNPLAAWHPPRQHASLQSKRCLRGDVAQDQCG